MNFCTIEVRLKPKAKNDRIALTNENPLQLDIAVTSPPIENRANEHVVKYLAKVLSVPKSTISIIKGEHSKTKVLKIETISHGDILNKIKEYFNLAVDKN